ncbi:MAG: protein kinase family protein [Muribaculaceae bacterium]|nr:protein kinase family protein [Muribaculaceae bacterium]
MDKNQPRWTEIEHLPEWDEEFYDVYTAKKFGKWVMLKTLKPDLRDKPEMQEMLEKEFDVRYNLAHPNIIMINDLEDVPGVGRCIITDDVYGDSLAKLMREGKVTEAHIAKLRQQLVDAMEYIQDNHLAHHPLRPENIIFTENIGNLKLIDVGFEQRSSLTPRDTAEDIYNYGLVVKQALDRSGIEDATLRRVAERCIDPDPKRRYRSVHSVRMALANRADKRVYLWIIAFLAVMVIVLVWLSIFPPTPVHS